jgi:hypothetical protein
VLLLIHGWDGFAGPTQFNVCGEVLIENVWLAVIAAWSSDPPMVMLPPMMIGGTFHAGAAGGSVPVIYEVRAISCFSRVVLDGRVLYDG